MMSIRPFVLQLILAVTCNGYIVKDGNCSMVSEKLPVVKNFELEKYLGKWYEIERYEQDYQRNMECVTVEYSQGEGNQSFEFKNKGLLPEKNAYASFSGSGILSDPTAEPLVGKLNISYGIKHAGDSNYWIMDTDYTSFALIYSCVPIVDTASVIEGYWLLSRMPELPEELQILEKVKFIQNTYFIADHVRTTNQSQSLCRMEPKEPVTSDILIFPLLPDVKIEPRK
ncbi:apolipoprotein D-like [Wyeomyia smithii]|uniref:apolipoprotein D-like n=1 Tax=Wyeomyia smithii TaxID=174621 RepID=UPI00246811E6|nr:apolipoprotein D-like [Wyeomyia smithii]